MHIACIACAACVSAPLWSVGDTVIAQKSRRGRMPLPKSGDAHAPRVAGAVGDGQNGGGRAGVHAAHFVFAKGPSSHYRSSARAEQQRTASTLPVGRGERPGHGGHRCAMGRRARSAFSGLWEFCRGRSWDVATLCHSRHVAPTFVWRRFGFTRATVYTSISRTGQTPPLGQDDARMRRAKERAPPVYAWSLQWVGAMTARACVG